MFQSIKGIIPGALRKSGIEHEVSASRVVEIAKECLIRLWGEERASFMEPLSFKEGTLMVSCRSSSASSLFRVLERPWINEINRSLGEKRVLRVVLRKDGF